MKDDDGDNIFNCELIRSEIVVNIVNAPALLTFSQCSLSYIPLLYLQSVTDPDYRTVCS